MLGHRKLEVPEYASILKRHWLILTVPAVVLAAVGFGLTFVIPPEYVSKTLVIIEPQRVADDLVKPVVADNLDQRLASMKEQILSRSRLQPIIDRYSLYSTQHMNADEKIETARKKISVDPIKSDISKSKGLPGFNVVFKNSDPRTAQLVCADITALFIQQSNKVSEDTAVGTTDFIKSQLDAAKRQLDEHDAKLADFERQYIGKLPGQENTNVSMLTSVTTQLQAVTNDLSRMEQDKSYQEAMIAQQSANASVGSPTSPSASVPATGPQPPNPQQTQLTALLAQEADLTAHYTADYPDVVTVRRKIADLRKEIAKTPAPGAITPGEQVAQAKAPDSVAIQQMQSQLHALEIGIDQKKRQQSELQKALGTYQDRISSTPMVEEQYKALTRENETAKTVYDNLLLQMHRAEMARALQSRQEGELFTTMDQANLPSAPTFPNPILFTVGGLVAGLAFGLGIVAILEYKDTALASERDIWAFTNLPTLAVIAYVPRDETVDVKKRGLLARLNPFSRKTPVPQS